MLRATFLLLSVCVNGWAQSYQGGVRGAVIDPSGAAVSTAAVLLVDQDTNAERQTRTNSFGEFVFSSIHPSNGILDKIIGGWSIHAVSAYRSGFPLAVTQQGNNNSVIGAGQRASATGISPQTPGSIQQRIDGYLNPAAFSPSAPYTFGNLSRSISMRGPGEANWDLSAFKTVAFRESVRAQFRAESYNAFNTPHFQRPNVSVGSANFGNISSQANFPRLIQLGVRVSF